MDKNKISAIVDVEACIGYRYRFQALCVNVYLSKKLGLPLNQKRMTLGRISIPQKMFCSKPQQFQALQRYNHFPFPFSYDTYVMFNLDTYWSVLQLDKSQFTVGYHWDPVRHVSDLKLASISFNKNIMKNANCLDFIQV